MVRADVILLVLSVSMVEIVIGLPNRHKSVEIPLEVVQLAEITRGITGGEKNPLNDNQKLCHGQICAWWVYPFNGDPGKCENLILSGCKCEKDMKCIRRTHDLSRNSFLYYCSENFTDNDPNLPTVDLVTSEKCDNFFEKQKIHGSEA